MFALDPTASGTTLEEIVMPGTSFLRPPNVRDQISDYLIDDAFAPAINAGWHMERWFLEDQCLGWGLYDE